MILPEENFAHDGVFQGDFHVSALSEGLPLFQRPSEEVRDRILERGPWSLAGQLLALEPWRPKFWLGWDTVTQLRVWLRLPDLPSLSLDE